MKKWGVATIVFLIISIWHSLVTWGAPGYVRDVLLASILPPRAIGERGIMGIVLDIALIWITLLLTFICWLKGRKYFAKNIAIIILLLIIGLFIVSLVSLATCFIYIS